MLAATRVVATVYEEDGGMEVRGYSKAVEIVHRFDYVDSVYSYVVALERLDEKTVKRLLRDEIRRRRIARTRGGPR